MPRVIKAKADAAALLGTALKDAGNTSVVEREVWEELVRLRSYPLANAQIEVYLRAAQSTPRLAGEDIGGALRPFFVACWLRGSRDTNDAMGTTDAT